MINYLDLFHGIGGFSLGAYWAGMKFDNHFCSDIEPYTIELYKKRFPDSVQIGDITKIDWHKLKKDFPGDWIISGGFPCQDISVAGKGRGLIDEKTGEKTRSGLWYDYQKGIDILRPRFAIMENVAALITRGLDEVLGSLSEIGYNAEWQSIRASDIGAPHRRERVWIISYPGHDARSSERKQQCKMSSKESVDMCTNGVGPWDEMADSNGKRFSTFRKSERIRKKEGEACSSIKRTSSLGPSWRTKWWESEPDFCRMANGVPRRVDRLKGLGNAIIPKIAEILFNKIKKHLE